MYAIILTRTRELCYEFVAFRRLDCCSSFLHFNECFASNCCFWCQLSKPRDMKAKVATFVVMLIFWVVLSGMFDAFHLTLGVICCMLVAHFSHDLLLFGDKEDSWVKGFIGLIVYLPWLFYQIILANLQVAYVVLHPRMLELIDPHVFRFKTRLRKPISKVTFAQSITLTPGTVTVSIHDDEFSVYALTRSASDALPGEMEERVARALESGR